MGLFKRRRSAAIRSAQTPGPHVASATLFTGDVTLEAVGESFYQDTLWAIVGGRTADYVRHPVVAALVPEFSNQYDANAVAVQIDGHVVGYLSRDDAEAYRPGILRIMNESNTIVALNGLVCGGGHRANGIGSLGVFLDHDPADFGVTGSHTVSDPGHFHHESLRTGFSEAGGDMSWLERLPEADRPAIKNLREMIATETNVTARHYMHAELERRLYRARDLYPEALGEFDQACRAHDEEMVSIRPALVTMFGGVPVLLTYRQMCIRQAKAKQWIEAERWATRGLAVYGTEALREEATEDLTKRLNLARAKLAAPAPRPTTERATKIAAPATSGPVIEVLVCQRCGASFERVVTRGRKPFLCPDCRAGD